MKNQLYDLMKIQIKSLYSFLLIIIFIANFNVLKAQKFGDIEMSKLEEKSHPKNPEASHAYIFKNCYVHYDLQTRVPKLISEYHSRIKIYTDEGVDQANIVRFIYRLKRDRDAIRDIKAVCYNIVNGKKEKTKLSKSEVYNEEVDEHYTKVSFALPNVSTGSIIEFKYKVVSPFLYSIPRHYFQEDVPVEFSQLKVDVPNYFTMAPIATGVVPLNRKVEEKIAFGADVTQYTFDASDIPGIEDDKYVLDINDYRASLKYELSKISYPGRNTQNFTKDWNSICKNLSKAKDFGDCMKKKVKPAKGLLNTISALSEKEKLFKIVDFINSHIAWNGKSSRYGSTNYKKLFEASEGDVTEINLLLINLCRKAGLEAHPVLTKNRLHGILNTNYPSLTEINYVFAQVKIDGEQLFVDATSPYFEPGNLPLRALNIQGVIMKGDKSQILALTNTNLNYKRFAGMYKFNLDKNRLEGAGNYVVKNYAAVKARRKLKEENNDEDQQEFLKEFNEEEEKEEDGEEDDDETGEDDVYNYSGTEGLENKYGYITSSFDAQLYSPLETIGDEIYIDAFVTLEFDENPFLKEMRKYPAFFNSKHHINHVSILEIPEGYMLKSRPENITLKMINDKGSFSYKINEAKGSITVNALFKINDDIFMSEEYASLYEFFNQIILKQKEKIVFVKE